MGTSSFALPSLAALVQSKFNVVAVYTQPPRPAGRGNKVQMSSVGVFSQKNNLKLFHPKDFANSSDVEELKKLNPDIVIVIAYGLILPKEVLLIPGRGFFNAHASLLPRWRGAAPIQRAILADDKKTGVSLIKMEPSLDTGPIVLKNCISIDRKETAGGLHEKLSLIAAKLTNELCIDIDNLNYRYQNTDGITYARKIEKSETAINWKSDARAVDRQIRAFSPYPGAWFSMKRERIKILECQVSDGRGKAGLIIDTNFQIACREGSIFPTRLQRAGKASLPINEFLRGYKVPVGKVLI